MIRSRFLRLSTFLSKCNCDSQCTRRLLVTQSSPHTPLPITRTLRSSSLNALNVTNLHFNQYTPLLFVRRNKTVAANTRNNHVTPRQPTSNQPLQQLDQQSPSLRSLIEQTDADLANRSNSAHRRQPHEGDVRFVMYENLSAYRWLRSLPEYRTHIGPLMDAGESTPNTGDFDLQPSWLLAPKSPPHQRPSPTTTTISNPSHRFVYTTIPTLKAADIVGVQRLLVRSVPAFSDLEQNNTLYYHTNLASVWTALDAAAVAQVNCVPTTNGTPAARLYPLLAIAGLWFELRLDGRVRFNQVLLRRLLSQATTDSDRLHFLHLMFLLNLNRSVDTHQTNAFISTVTAYFDAHHHHHHHHQPSIGELALVGMAFFKTQTRMPQTLLTRYIALVTEAFRQSTNPTDGLVGCDGDLYLVMAILKAIRFSLETNAFDAFTLRPVVRPLVDAVVDTAPLYSLITESSVGLTHLILLLNSAYLQNYRSLYKRIFDRMMDRLADGFRLKDIERVLQCLANGRFRCPMWRLRSLELHVTRDPQCHVFTDCVVTIVHSFLMLGYNPQQLLFLLRSELLANLLASPKRPKDNILLAIDASVRLEWTNVCQPLLTADQVDHCRAKITLLRESKKLRFLNSINAILREHFPHRFRSIHLLPFVSYPFPVLLTGDSRQAQHLVSKSPPNADAVVPFRLSGLESNHFAGCVAFLPLTHHDFIFGPSIRGHTALTERLLTQLGLTVVHVPQKDYPDFALPDHVRQPNSEQYRKLVRAFLHTVPHEAGSSGRR